MKILNIVGAVAAVLLLPAGTAMAQQASGPRPGMGYGRGVMMRDLDHDGYVSRVEHRSWAAEVFAAMDRNGDGKLTRDEYMAVRMGPGPRGGGMGSRRAAMQAQMRARKQARFAAMDTDGNGVVTRTQFMRQSDRNFAELDVNHDGRISMAEFRRGYGGM